MKITYYFKIDFKRPNLNESIAQIIEKKNKLKDQLDFCYSRLETIELCNNDSKLDDALLLSDYLICDITSLVLIYEDKLSLITTDNWREKIKTLLDSKVISAFNKHISVIEKDYKSKEEKSVKIEESIAELLYFLEKFIFAQNKSIFENPVDDFNKKIKVQLFFSLIFIGLFSYNGFQLYNKIKPIRKDFTKLYFLGKQNSTPKSSNLITVEVNPSEDWKEVNFILPSSSEIESIKIEPIHQVNARIQIKEIKFLDESKKILLEQNFKINKLGMLESEVLNKICCLEGLKPGKVIPENT
ncbi:MAG: hypothetical protein IPL26_22165 [Leptospiraceae bacterium]|nr:hypothetical protein [Leptospiraceae bacterium]